MQSTKRSYPSPDKIKRFFSDYPEREFYFVAGLRISYFVANFVISVLVTYLTETWQVDLFHAVAITNIRAGAQGIFVIFIACLAHAYLGNSRTLLLSGILYSMGLLLLWFIYPHLTEVDMTNCVKDDKKCVEKPLGPFFYLALVLITVGQCGYANYEECEKDRQLGVNDNKEAIDKEETSSQDGMRNQDSCCARFKKKIGFKKWADKVIGLTIALSVVSRIPNSSGGRFLMPACMLGGSCILFIVGKLYFYPFDGRDKSPFLPIFLVFEAAYRKRHYDIHGTCEYFGDEDMADEHEDHNQDYKPPNGDSILFNGNNADRDNNQTVDDSIRDDGGTQNSEPWEDKCIGIIKGNCTDDHDHQKFGSHNAESSTDVEKDQNLQLQSGNGDLDGHNPISESEKDNDGIDEPDHHKLQNFEPLDDKSIWIINDNHNSDDDIQKFGSHKEDSTSDVDYNQKLELQRGFHDDHNPWKEKNSVDNYDDHNPDLKSKNDNDGTDDGDQQNQIPHQQIDLKDKLRFFNRAALYKRSEYPRMEVKKRRLCTVKQVEEAKHFTRAMWLSSTFVMYGIMTAICNAFFVLQVSNMDRHVNRSTTVPIQVIMMTSILTTGTVTPLIKCILAKNITALRRRFYGALRIGVGMLLSVPCFVIASLVEHKRQKTDNISAFWLIPPLFLKGVMDGLALEGMKDFFEHEFPNSLSRSYGTFLIEAVKGTGKLYSVGLLYLLRQVTKRDGQPGWFGFRLDDSHLVYLYIFMVGFGFTSCIVYAFVAIMDSLWLPRVQSESSTFGPF